MLLSTLTALALGVTSIVAAPSPGRQVRCGHNPSAEAVASAEADFKSKKLSFKQAVNATSSFAATIPISWHVVTSGDANIEENVTPEQIAASVEVLNKDYTGSGFSFTLLGTDRVIEPNWFHNVAGSNTLDLEMKTALRQGNAATLNIYTAAPVDEDPTKKLLGYATLPKDYNQNPKADGVVIHYTTLPGGSSLGSNLGRTLTHEVGHWFGLLHTFEGGCDGDGDGVVDTPPQATPTDGCPVEGAQDTCPGGGVDAIHNFMDYSNDACMREFTPGQINRMQEMMTFYRSS